METIKPFPYKTEESKTTTAGRLCHQNWREIMLWEDKKYNDPHFPHGPEALFINGDSH